MKVSFSTLGCPEWSWEDMTVTAKDLGFDGIELRGIESEMYVPRAKQFSARFLETTVNGLKKLGLEIPCVTSSCYLFDKNDIDRHLQEGRDYIDLASSIGAPFVRVLADRDITPGGGVDFDFTASSLSILARYAHDRNVTVLVETNGVFADSTLTARLIEKVQSPDTGVLWDVHHPFRFMNEPVEKTFAAIGKYVKHVHVKDSVVQDGKLKYKIMGQGDVPIRKAVDLLRNEGYSGHVSLEWVKRWNLDLEDPGIVFSHFVSHIRSYMESD